TVQLYTRTPRSVGHGKKKDGSEKVQETSGKGKTKVDEGRPEETVMAAEDEEDEFAFEGSLRAGSTGDIVFRVMPHDGNVAEWQQQTSPPFDSARAMMALTVRVGGTVHAMIAPSHLSMLSRLVSTLSQASAGITTPSSSVVYAPAAS